MERPTATMLRIGAWCVNPTSGQISRDGESARVEVRTMRLLLCLAEHAGEVVSIDDLLNQAWPEVIVTPDSVYQAVASLRRLLGDDPKRPTYIETVPRLGYRMVAMVSPWADQSIAPAGSSRASDREPTPASAAAPTPGPSLRAGFSWAAGVALCLVLLVAFLFHGRVANHNHSASPAIALQPQKSIAVLPFLDLTDGMNEEPFADGMTEELIDKFSKIPDFRVPAPTSSFYFKGKQITIANIAKTLGVAYVLDGSVRTSGARLRVAARLIRADNGYVIWSETYDRPLHDVLMVQDDIAGEVTKALRASIEARTGLLKGSLKDNHGRIPTFARSTPGEQTTILASRLIWGVSSTTRARRSLGATYVQPAQGSQEDRPPPSSNFREFLCTWRMFGAAGSPPGDSVA